MMVLRELRRRARAVVVPFLGIALSGYFVYHAIEGDRGVLAWMRLTQQMSAAKARLAAVQTTRDALAQKVAVIGRDGIDRDLLDQEVRARLNLAAPGQIVIMLDRPPAPGASPAQGNKRPG
jgi:cell division protein FtsB